VLAAIRQKLLEALDVLRSTVRTGAIDEVKESTTLKLRDSVRQHGPFWVLCRE
jgi:hypothetical protein